MQVPSRLPEVDSEAVRLRMSGQHPQLADGDRFFLFLPDNADSAYRAKLDLPSYPRSWADFLTGKLEMPDLVKGSHNMDREALRDVIGNALILLSDRVLNLMTSAGITGWRSKPCRLRSKRGRPPIDGYNLLIVDGRCGEFDWSLSREIEEYHPPGRIEVRRQGVTFDLASWDGSDVFVPAKSCAVAISEKVRACFLDNGVSGAFVKALSEWKRL